MGYLPRYFLTRSASRRAGVVKKHQDILKAEQTYGVDRYIVAAIIGVETFYGTRQGNYRVLDCSQPLAFDYPTARSFGVNSKPLPGRKRKARCRHIKRLLRRRDGHGQFIPTSFLCFAVDADQDGKRDLVD